MKNRPNIAFERTNKGFVGTFNSDGLFIVTRGATKKVVRKEIAEAIKSF